MMLQEQSTFEQRIGRGVSLPKQGMPQLQAGPS
jgi:hypothetical protein